MSIKEITEQYYTELDDVDRAMIDRRVKEKGIEEYLNQQLVYLNCSRVIQGMRMMQTIGYPYKKEISSYIYVLEIIQDDTDYYKIWHDKLIERHNANIEYEKENPPIWYDGKPKKNATRKPKAKEGDMFPEETKKAKMSKAQAKLIAKISINGVKFGNFKIKNK